MTEKLDRETVRKIVAAFNETDLDMDMNELKINVLAVQNLRVKVRNLMLKWMDAYKICYPETVLALCQALADVVRYAKYEFLNEGKL